MIRQASDQNLPGSFSKREISSPPLRVKVKGLTTQPSSTPMFSDGCSDCVSSFLSFCLPLSHNQQTASLAARKEEVLRKVHAEVAAKHWSKSYNLIVEHDPIDDRLFDGSMIEYDESGEFKEMCKTVAEILECTENNDELQADHLLSKHTRYALGIKGNKAVCLFTDKELHTKKTNDSVNHCKIEGGNVNLEDVYDNFMKRHIELVRDFFLPEKLRIHSEVTQLNDYKLYGRMIVNMDIDGEDSPKLSESILASITAGERKAQTVVYSNFYEEGILKLSAFLKTRGAKHRVLTPGMAPEAKDRIVNGFLGPQYSDSPPSSQLHRGPQPAEGRTAAHSRAYPEPCHGRASDCQGQSLKGRTITFQDPSDVSMSLSGSAPSKPSWLDCEKSLFSTTCGPSTSPGLAPGNSSPGSCRTSRPTVSSSSPASSSTRISEPSSRASLSIPSTRCTSPQNPLPAAFLWRTTPGWKRFPLASASECHNIMATSATFCRRDTP